uniref:Uncharacterized protein n=1 Tax=Brassica oleracea TaxID=3712 RepID=A0A3P6H9N3_BRAOL|nr:unnamed protein product [Brassica oleracea]
MYASLFEVSQWWQGRLTYWERRKITLISCFGGKKWLTRNEKKHII